MKKLYVVVLMSLLAPIAWGAQRTPAQLLAKADEIRNPQLDYTSMVTVTSYKGDKASKSTFKTLIKGKTESVVVTLTPQIDRGRVLLMSGANFWGFLPNVSKPLRISLQERLFGEVANGDLARANFTGDYTPSIAKRETIGGKKYVVLDLKATSENVTYGRVMLWVDETNVRPLKADFYAFSGRLLKQCQYENFREFGGAIRPTRLVMRDAVNKENHSVVTLDSIKVGPLPDKYFTKDYMKKFADE